MNLELTLIVSSSYNKKYTWRRGLMRGKCEKQCGNGKRLSPRLGLFFMAFISGCWEVIMDKWMDMFCEFQCN